MKNKISKTKKGALTTVLVDFWAYIAFVLIILIFYLLFSVESRKASDNKITELEIKSASYLTLLNFLKTPVNVEGEDIIIADLIRIWYLEPNKYKDLLAAKSAEILNKLEYEYPNSDGGYTSTRGYNIIINSEKREYNSLDHLISLQSKSFDNDYAVISKNWDGIAIQGEQHIPVKRDQSLYEILIESEKPK